MTKIIANGRREISASIYFTDSSMAKIRPVLVIKTNSFGDALFLLLTSNLLTKGIQVDNRNLQEGNLPKKSVVVHEKPGVIAKSLLLRKIGTLQAAVYETIISELVKFIQS